MSRRKYSGPTLIAVAAVAAAVGCLVGQVARPDGESASAAARGEAGNERPVYYPGTEELAPDEMRVTALGTGLPTPLTRAQKSTAWMLELGNGDAFIFDMGTGAMENVFGLRPDFSKLDKVFLSHLHSDHFGDMDALIVGGWLSGRYTPLHVYGPSGATPELGTKAAMEGLLKALAWDLKGRSGILPDAGGRVIPHEFDYKGVNQVVYDHNGVKITSWPAIHSLDGSVSYRVEWNGLSFVFGGDTRPNKWFIEHAKDADFVIHECFPTPEGLAAFNDWQIRQATFVSSYIHTPPEGFGKVMSAVKPRMAVAFHTVLLPDIQQGDAPGNSQDLRWSANHRDRPYGVERDQRRHHLEGSRLSRPGHAALDHAGLQEGPPQRRSHHVPVRHGRRVERLHPASATQKVTSYDSPSCRSSSSGLLPLRCRWTLSSPSGPSPCDPCRLRGRRPRPRCAPRSRPRASPAGCETDAPGSSPRRSEPAGAVPNRGLPNSGPAVNASMCFTGKAVVPNSMPHASVLFHGACSPAAFSYQSVVQG